MLLSTSQVNEVRLVLKLDRTTAHTSAIKLSVSQATILHWLASIIQTIADFISLPFHPKLATVPLLHAYKALVRRRSIDIAVVDSGPRRTVASYLWKEVPF